MGMRLAVPALDWLGPVVLRQWLKEDGDWVNAGQPVCELSAGSRSAPVVALESGFLSLASSPPHRAGAVVHRLEQLGCVISPGDAESDLRVRLPSLPPRPTRPSPVDHPELRALAHRTNSARTPISPRAKARTLLYQLDPGAILPGGHSGRITTRDIVLAPSAAAGGSAVHGKIATTARLLTQAGETPQAIMDKLRAKAGAVMQDWLRATGQLRGLAHGRWHAGQFHFEAALPTTDQPGVRHGARRADGIMPDADVALLDLTELPCDWLELPGFACYRLVVVLGRVRLRRQGTQSVAESTVSLQFDPDSVGFATLAPLLERLASDS